MCTGALQSHDVRDAICEVMEGGKEALKKDIIVYLRL